MPHPATILAACARTAYEAIRAFEEALGHPDNRPSWTEASKELQKTWIGYAERLFDARKPDARNPGLSPPALHDVWCKDRMADGWKPGPVFNALDKTDPTLVPFEQLSQADKARSAIVIHVMNAVATQLRPIQMNPLVDRPKLSDRDRLPPADRQPEGPLPKRQKPAS